MKRKTRFRVDNLFIPWYGLECMTMVIISFGLLCFSNNDSHSISRVVIMDKCNECSTQHHCLHYSQCNHDSKWYHLRWHLQCTTSLLHPLHMNKTFAFSSFLPSLQLRRNWSVHADVLIHLCTTVYLNNSYLAAANGRIRVKVSSFSNNGCRATFMTRLSCRTKTELIITIETWLRKYLPKETLLK